jgi:hypothetical protein
MFNTCVIYCSYRSTLNKQSIYYVIIFIIILVIQTFVLQQAFALSAFAHQEIPVNNKWYDLLKGEPINIVAKGEHAFTYKNTAVQNSSLAGLLPLFPHLDSVSYVSDGKTLNATLWLNKPFEEKPPSGIKPSYGILIDADSNPSTGWAGVDYMFQIIWNPRINNWTYEIEEWGSHAQARIFVQKDSYTGFFGKGGGGIGQNISDYNVKYVHLSLNLDDIGPINQANVIFFVGYDFVMDGHPISIADFSGWVPIPPPRFVILPLPSFISIRPYENKTVLLQVQSNTSLPSKVTLNAEQIGDIKVNFFKNSKEIYVPPNGIGRSELWIYNLKNGNFNASKIQITADISFPISYAFMGMPNLQVNGTQQTEHSYLSLVFMYPQSLSDYITASWNTWGVAVSGFITSIAALIGIIKREWFLKIWNKLKSNNNKQDMDNKQQ